MEWCRRILKIEDEPLYINGLLFMVHAHFYHFHRFSFIGLYKGKCNYDHFSFLFSFSCFTHKICISYFLCLFICFICLVLCIVLFLILSSSEHLLYFWLFTIRKYIEVIWVKISSFFLIFLRSSLCITSLIIFALSVSFEIFEFHSTQSTSCHSTCSNNSSNNNDNNNDEMQAS